MPSLVNHQKVDVPLREIVIYRHTIGKPSETFVTEQSNHFKDYTPLLLARDKLVRPFPLAHLSFIPESQCRRLVHGLTGTPFFALRALSSNTVRPSLVHAHFAFDAVYAMRVASRLNVPLIVTLHGIDVTASNHALLTSKKLAWWRYLLDRRALGREAAFFICVSEHIRAAAGKFFPQEKLVLAYLGIDLARFTPTALPASPKILHVARLVEKKGTRYLLQALAEVKKTNPAATLTIVGTGPLEASLKTLARNLGLESSVDWVVVATPTEISDLLRACRVFCLPSVTAANGDTEGLPISILEAMAAGRPVVSTHHAGIPEAIGQNIAGLLVKERDVGALAAAISLVLGDSVLAERLARNARKTAEAKFDVRKCAARTEEIYRSAEAAVPELSRSGHQQTA